MSGWRAAAVSFLPPRLCPQPCPHLWVSLPLTYVHDTLVHVGVTRTLQMTHPVLEFVLSTQRIALISYQHTLLVFPLFTKTSGFAIPWIYHHVFNHIPQKWTFWLFPALCFLKKLQRTWFCIDLCVCDWECRLDPFWQMFIRWREVFDWPRQNCDVACLRWEGEIV